MLSTLHSLLRGDVIKIVLMEDSQQKEVNNSEEEETDGGSLTDCRYNQDLSSLVSSSISKL